MELIDPSGRMAKSALQVAIQHTVGAARVTGKSVGSASGVGIVLIKSHFLKLNNLIILILKIEKKNLSSI